MRATTALRWMRAAALAPALALSACRADFISPDAVRQFTTIASGGVDCGIRGDGTTWCWGGGGYGQLGYGVDTSSAVPLPVAGGHRFVSLAVGFEHACAVDEEGAVWCWGANYFAQLGAIDSAALDDCRVSRGFVDACLVPMRLTDDARYTTVTAGPYHTCGITTTGDARCWGRNDFAQLGATPDTACQLAGYWAPACSPAPVTVPGGHRFTQLSAGTGHTCGLTAGGVAWCWGLDASGQLGDSVPSEPSVEPVRVRGERRFEQIAAGGGHTCGLAQDKQVYCWGGNGLGTVGADLPDSVVPAPTPVAGGRRWRDVAAWGVGVCAVAESDQMFCWGGRSPTWNVWERVPVPTPLPGSTPFVSVEPGARCGIARTLGAFCWRDGRPPEPVAGQW